MSGLDWKALRAQLGGESVWDFPTCHAAAEEIESLRAQLAEREAEVETLKLGRDALLGTERRLREGLLYLGYAMRDGNTDRIREKWGGNTPEDWCGEADALHGILDEVARLREENEGLRGKLDAHR